MASFLLSPDRATLQLLHVLDWRPVLQQLAPVTAHLQSTLSGTTTAQQASLLDNDMSSSTSDAGLAPSQQSGVRSSQGGLDAGGKAWAAQLLLLVMQAYVIMADDDLPDWISRLIKGRSDRDLVAGVLPSDLLHTFRHMLFCQRQGTCSGTPDMLSERCVVLLQHMYIALSIGLCS